MSYVPRIDIEPRLDPDRVSLLGAGRLARAALGMMQGAKRAIYARRSEVREVLRVKFDRGIEFPVDMETAIRGAQVLMIAVHADQVREVAQEMAPFVTPDQIILLASRGVSADFHLPHEEIRNHTCVRKIGVIGGPLHVRELASGRRMNAVVASRYREVIAAVLRLSKGAPMSVEASTDIVGVQVAGAIANVASIGAGMAEALDLGGTARGVLLARGIVEARTVGVALGADPETFSGLAGLGEMIPRAVRYMERHLDLGRALGRGTTLEAAQSEIEGHVEGVTTAREGARWARHRNLNVPLLHAVADVIDGRASARESLEGVLAYPLELSGKAKQ